MSAPTSDDFREVQRALMDYVMVSNDRGRVVDRAEDWRKARDAWLTDPRPASEKTALADMAGERLDALAAALDRYYGHYPEHRKAAEGG